MIRQPKYRLHKARNCAVVTIDGKDHYLGALNSSESWEKYHRLVAEFLASGNNPLPADIGAESPLTITELAARYRVFAKSRYQKNGQPTSEVAAIRHAL